MTTVDGYIFTGEFVDQRQKALTLCKVLNTTILKILKYFSLVDTYSVHKHA